MVVTDDSLITCCSFHCANCWQHLAAVVAAVGCFAAAAVVVVAADVTIACFGRLVYSLQQQQLRSV